MTADSLIDSIADYEPDSAYISKVEVVNLIRQHEADCHSEVYDDKCPDCGANMIEVCSGLENICREAEAGKCRRSAYEQKSEPVSIGIPEYDKTIGVFHRVESGFKLPRAPTSRSGYRCKQQHGSGAGEIE